MKYLDAFLEQAEVLNLDRFIKQYHEISGMTCLIKLEGYGEFIGAGRRTICHLVNEKDLDVKKSCMQRDLGKLNADIPSFQQYECPLKLIEYARPLVIDDQVLGYAYVGQVLSNKIDQNTVTEVSSILGFSESDVELFYEELPVLSKKQINSHIAFFNSLMDLWLGKITDSIRYNENATVQNEKIARELHERFLIDKANTYIAKTGWSETGESFLIRTATFIAELLEVDQVMINEFKPPSQVQTLAVVDRGVVKPNFTYDLHGTPCENVIGKQFTYYHLDVCECFPEDMALVHNNFKSYAGLPLWKASGEPLGLIVLLGRKKFLSEELTEQLLTTFSVRIAHEMQYQEYIESELERSQQLEKMVVERTDELTSMNEELLATLDELQNTQMKLIENENKLAVTAIVKGLNDRLGTPLGNLFMSFSFFDELITENRNELIRYIDEQAVEGFRYSHDVMKKSIDQLIEINTSMREVLSTQNYGAKEEVNLYESVVTSLNTFTVDGMTDQIKANIDVSKNVTIKTYPKSFDVIMGQLLAFTRSNISETTKPEISISTELHKDSVKFTYIDSNDYKHIDLESLFHPLSNYSRGKKNTGFEMYTVHHVVTERMRGSIRASKTDDGFLSLVMELPK
ncbi:MULTISPECIES: PocR ligand-binding domain-containing protein [unclassified Fusibacter]|uniref:PocR ligand-binding domain-containing protein n=1 Tax=unclassified Fusibacter TaxID=2624464 RepID=UPI0010136DE4|nr:MULTISPECIES: PocR ligand-binding domain-containing protein [unclassified Fusibacter]MCK8061581.1 PocR ligand-binding domain-containing protein [Fusibacter sp. A2]NPE23764.1 hypothetical protein [Fusibacter sp. A1]RXV58670.1 hypothetical protein DWB64_18425 [Fusibacter sp. A1]